jgi:type II secretory pathway pseudopilin PulG
MIFKRAIAKLRAQDWTAISIELAIVIIGVFIGTWVANWNQKRSEQREATALILRLGPQLAALEQAETAERTYYATTRRFGEMALKAWDGNAAIDDRDFVVAAYQASQVNGLPIDSQTFSLAMGADQIRKIEDQALRDAIVQIMTYNFDSLHVSAMQTPYRQHVREIIPDDIQHAIRQRCHDVQHPGLMTVTLPAHCPVKLDPVAASRAAAALRSHPELPRELVFHLAQSDTFLGILERFETRVRTLVRLIDKQRGS